MHPRVETRGFAVEETPDGLRVVREASGEEVLLHPLAARVMRLADGTRSVPAIQAALDAEAGGGVARETVFRALDALADAGLLQSRAAPPGGVVRIGRRDMLRRVAAASLTAAVAGAGALGAPQAARAGDVADREQNRKQHAESKVKHEAQKDREAEQKAKLKAKSSEQKAKEKALKDKQKAEEKAKHEAARG